MSQEQIDSSTKKRIKLNEQDQKQDIRDWIVIKKKTTPLTISISDHTKVHRFYSHKSIQKYIRYLFTQTCVNPMWLAIKRQSQIQHIYYIDIEIEDYLFQKMLQQKTLHFLSQKITGDNKAVFREQRLNRFLWDSLLVYDEQEKLAKQEAIQQIVNSNRVQKKMSAQIYRKYLSSILTPQELKQNLYPDVKLPLYQTYHTIIPKQQLYFNNTTITNNNNNNTQQNQQQQPVDKNDKNLILVIDCEMVSTQQGFELARCTIVNYQQEVIFDEFFKPKNPILSYNTEYSGITKEILDPITNTIENTLYPYLSKMITPDTILIGHSLENDYNAMKFYHPKVVDTSVLFRRKNGSKMKLKNLADKILNRKIQSFTHDSKEDCLATLHLVQAKVENEQLINFQKQYHLLRDLVKAKHGILVVDYDIQNVLLSLIKKMKQYNSIHFQKVQPCESPQKITQIIKRYSNKTQVSVPKAAFTRFQKPQIKDWQIYYEQIDHALEKLYSAVPQGTVFFLNFQVNELVRIVPFSAQQANKQRTRPFFAPIPKNN